MKKKFKVKIQHTGVVFFDFNHKIVKLSKLSRCVVTNG